MKGSVIERKGKNGRVSYQLKYDLGKDPGTGKRRTHRVTVKGATSKKDAQKELRKLLKQIDDGTHVDPDKKTFGNWQSSWLETIRNAVSAKTFERYEDLLRLHVVPYVGELSIQKLKGTHIDNIYAQLRTKTGLSEQTILHVHRVLSLCLKEATRKQLVPRNVAQDAKAPRPNAARSSESADENNENIKALTPEELTRLLMGFKGHDLFDVVALAAGTGARRGELLALSWDKIDFENNTLSIVRSVEDTNSLGANLKTTKNKASKRKIGIDEDLVHLLRKRKLRHSEDLLKVGAHLPGNALIFPQSILEPFIPCQPRNVTKVFIKKAKQLGFVGLKFHDLRHTHATLLLEANVPVHAVAQRLGHSTPNQTLATYSHVLKRSEDKAVSVASSLLKGSL